MENEEMRSKVARLKHAVHNPGINPEYHRQKLRQLSAEWPTLYLAIRSLTDG